MGWVLIGRGDDSSVAMTDTRNEGGLGRCISRFSHAIVGREGSSCASFTLHMRAAQKSLINPFCDPTITNMWLPR